MHSSLSCPSRGSIELLCQLHGRCCRPLRRRMKSSRSNFTAGLRLTNSSRLMPSRRFSACSAEATSPATADNAPFTSENRASTSPTCEASSGFLSLRYAMSRSIAGRAALATAESSASFSRRENAPASTRNVQLPFPFGAVRPPRASKRTAPFGTGRMMQDGAWAEMKRRNASPPTFAVVDRFQFTRLRSTLPHPASLRSISRAVASTREPSAITNTGSHQMAWSKSYVSRPTVAVSFTSSAPATFSETGTAFSAPLTTGVSAARAKTAVSTAAPHTIFLNKPLIATRSLHNPTPGRQDGQVPPPRSPLRPSRRTR